MLTHEHESARDNINCLLESEGLVMAARSQLHCKCGSISDTVQDGVVTTTDHSQEVIYDLPSSENWDSLEQLSRSFTYCKPC